MQTFKQLLCIIVTAFFLTACGGNVSQENFDKVENSMTPKEVEQILGKPTSSESVNVGGFSGTSSVWKKGDIEITIQFLNGQVFLKTLSKGEKDK